MKEKVENIYLDYFNNFLTVQYFADYYDLTYNKALRLINVGRKLNHRRKSKYI